jgi:hypothetical protein
MATARREATCSKTSAVAFFNSVAEMDGISAILGAGVWSDW